MHHVAKAGHQHAHAARIRVASGVLLAGAGFVLPGMTGTAAIFAGALLAVAGISGVGTPRASRGSTSPDAGARKPRGAKAQRFQPILPQDEITRAEGRAASLGLGRILQSRGGGSVKTRR